MRIAITGASGFCGGVVARLAAEVFLEYTPLAVEHTLELVQRFTSLVAVRAGRRVGFMAAEVGHGDRAALHAIAVSACALWLVCAVQAAPPSVDARSVAEPDARAPTA